MIDPTIAHVTLPDGEVFQVLKPVETEQVVTGHDEAGEPIVETRELPRELDGEATAAAVAAWLETHPQPEA